jgi:hypothetical protein
MTQVMQKIPNISQNVTGIFFPATSNTAVSPYKRQEKCFSFLQCKLTYIKTLFLACENFQWRGGGGEVRENLAYTNTVKDNAYYITCINTAKFILSTVY